MPLAASCRKMPCFLKWETRISLSVWAKSPMVRMPRVRRRSAVECPTYSKSPTGRGQNFAGSSSGNRVCTKSGFLKSEAVLASKRFVEIPTLTVKPSSSRISSFTLWAKVTKSPYNPSVPVISQKASSMLNCSTTGAYRRKSSMKARERSRYREWFGFAM